MDKEQIKLKQAAEEIKDILRKYDIAGAVALHNPGHGEYFVHLNPSYSCAYIYNDNEVRFYSKREDYTSKEEQTEKQTNTSNMLKVLEETTSILFMQSHEMSTYFDKLVEAKHT